MKFIFLFLFIYSQFVFSQVRFDELIKARTLDRSVVVSSIVVGGHSEWVCDEYEGGNGYDGACIAGHFNCRIKLKFPHTNYLGKPEAYRMSAATSFQDFEVKDHKNCQEEFRLWQQENSEKVLHYTFHEALYRINYQPSFGADCFQRPSIKPRSSLGLIITDWSYDDTSPFLGGEDKYKVPCKDLVTD